MIPAEEWRPVVGFEGSYEVSSLGRVRSLDRTISNPLPSGTVRRQQVKGRILKPGVAKCGGYLYVNLSRGNKNQRSHHVHRLVMDAFVGPLPDLMQTRHLNGDPSDCRLANLAYGTPAENGLDKRRHGTSGWTDRCKRGHPRTPENTKWRREGFRECIPCMRARYLERRGLAA